MKTKTKQELRNSDLGELKKKLIETKKTFSSAMLEHKQFKLKNTSSLTTLRKEVAVIQTLIKEKETALQKQA